MEKDMTEETLKVTMITPQVHHILTPGYVYCTLIIGEKKALLIDTGYGVSDLKEYVERITDKPYEVVNTHGHPDHVLGNDAFPYTWISPEEIGVIACYTLPEKLAMTKEELQDAVASERLADYTRKRNFSYRWLQEGQIFDLGGIHLEAVALPGHTPGSMGLLWKEKRFLFAGDALNPSLWLFMDECSSLLKYRNMLEKALELPFDEYLFSHSDSLVKKDFLYTVQHHIDRIKVDENTRKEMLGYETYTSAYTEGDYTSEIVFSEAKLQRRAGWAKKKI